MKITIDTVDNGYILSVGDYDEDNYVHVYSKPGEVVAAVTRLLQCKPEDLA